MSTSTLCDQQPALLTWPGPLPEASHEHHVMPSKPKPVDEAAAMVARGYRVVSRAQRIVARIDRPDWAKTFGVSHLLGCQARAEDQYRRCHSKDARTVSSAVLAHIPGSHRSVTGFVP